MSTLDLVEEFRALDEVDDDNNVESSDIGKLSGQHSRIGGADLSGISALDDDDNRVFGDAAVKDLGATTGASSPLPASASFLEDEITAGRNQGGVGRLCAFEREAAESDAWDSDDDGQGADSLGETLNNDGVAVLGGASSGRLTVIRGGGVELEQSRKPAAGSPADSGSVEYGGLNQSSPKRPVEEGSDWDEGTGQSSDDAESERGRRPPPFLDCELRWSKVSAERKTGDQHHPSPKLSPPIAHERYRQISSSSSRRPSTQSSGPVETPMSVIHDDVAGRRSCEDGGPNQTRSRSGDEVGTQEMFPPIAEGSQVAAEAGAEAGAGEGAGEAATIQALRAELSTLRELVLRSERKREAQLHELGTRLEVQERRSGPSATERTRLSATNSTVQGEGEIAIVRAAFAGDEAAETGACQEKGGSRGTPRGTFVYNPFAGTGGGAGTTPRDHFPAFEDALLNRGDDDENEATPRGDEGGDEGGHQRGEGGVAERGYEGSKSAIHNEAFDFSIDTLSHINNHTDFGTAGTPVAAGLPAATATTSPNIGRDGKGVRGYRERARLPRVMAEPSAAEAGGHLKGDSGADEAEEVFDEKDTAAEEAFFSDACATASLQTPVKHMLATAASDPGVAVRGGRTGAEISTPARRNLPISSSKGEHQESRNGVQGLSVGRPPHGRESPLSDTQSPELCMADVFARASAELEGDAMSSGEEGDGGMQVKRGGATSGGPSAAGFPPSGKGAGRSVGVDAACQTSWSFSAHDEVRFVSVPGRSPLSTRMADGRGYRRGVEEGVGGRNLASRSGGELEKESCSSAALGAENCVPDGGRGPCCTPRRFGRPLCQNPSRGPPRKCGERLGEGSSSVSETSSFFNSPNLSPIAVARAGPVGAAAYASQQQQQQQWAGALSAGARNGVSPGGNGGWQEDEEDKEGGSSATRIVSSARWQQQCYGLSPILSVRGGSASSEGGGDGRQAFDPHARGEFAGESRGSSGTGAGPRVGVDDGARGAETASGRRDLPILFGGALPVLRRAAEPGDRTSGSGPLFMDSSADVTRSSVLRASSTLHTIAPLDDTGPPFFSCGSRAGASFAGELFADSRLRASLGAERVPRYDVFVPRGGEQLRRGDGGACTLPPVHMPRHPSEQQQHQRRSRSAPTLPSEWPMHGSHFEPDRIPAAGMPGEAPSVGPGGVPRDVVEAWLAVAIEGIYSHSASHGSGGGSRGGSGVVDKRIGSRIDPGSAGRDGLLSPGPAAAETPAVVKAGQTLPTRADHMGASVYVAGPGDSPPPPPPPLDMRPNGAVDEAVNEEDIFYQRQRLLQRVVSAAASHGGVMPSLSSVRDTSLGEDQKQEQEQEQDVVGGSKMVEREGSWRRHSDPSSWKTPPPLAVATAAAAAAAAGAAEAREASARNASRWPVSGAPAAYMRRRTSGYWRDRLGMTH